MATKSKSTVNGTTKSWPSRYNTITKIIMFNNSKLEKTFNKINSSSVKWNRNVNAHSIFAMDGSTLYSYHYNSLKELNEDWRKLIQILEK
jgi:hypothetical protein